MPLRLMVWEFALPSMIESPQAGGDTLHSQPREKPHGVLDYPDKNRHLIRDIRSLCDHKNMVAPRPD
jgi:hypothetical protein